MIVLFKDLNSVIDVDDEVHGIFTSDLTGDLHSDLRPTFMAMPQNERSEKVSCNLHDMTGRLLSIYIYMSHNSIVITPVY